MTREAIPCTISQIAVRRQRLGNVFALLGKDRVQRVWRREGL